MTVDKEKLTRLAAENEIKFIVLFGSQAKKNAHKESDFDVAVLTSVKNNINENADVYNKIFLGLTEILSIPEDKVDLTNLNNASPYLRYEVIKNGELLYGNIRDYVLFKLYSIRMHQENGKIYALRDKLIKKRQEDLKEKFRLVR